MKSTVFLFLATLLLSTSAGTALASGLAVELEAGPVWQTKNDIQIPNDRTGTRFSLVDLAGSGPTPAGRLTVTWDFARRHGLRAMGAPLRIEASGTPTSAIAFAGETFPAGAPVETIAEHIEEVHHLTPQERDRALQLLPRIGMLISQMASERGRLMSRLDAIAVLAGEQRSQT